MTGKIYLKKKNLIFCKNKFGNTCTSLEKLPTIFDINTLNFI